MHVTVQLYNSYDCFWLCIGFLIIVLEMGKKSKTEHGAQLGRSLIKDRFGSTKGKKMVSNNTMLHTTEIQDGYEWGRLNLQSVTEESSFQEFLSTAELAGTEFQAEKLNIKFVNPRSNVGLLNKEELKIAKDAHEKHKTNLKIPRRPVWNSDMTAEYLDKNEKKYFLEWRRSLACLQEVEHILLTPYEKNLEFWRQLWRVVERSDVIVQIVDARNPLLFRCEDLEKYVKEVSEQKLNLILINKADFLTEQQRLLWANYFSTVGVHIIFFSARLAAEDVIQKSKDNNDKYCHCQDSDNQICTADVVKQSIIDLELAVNKSEDELNDIIKKMEQIVDETNAKEVVIQNSSKVLKCDELIEQFRSLHKGQKVTNNITTIGFVGYPNVGKSSTINALMGTKKVSVSATPGKTKHFQTLYLDNDILLCDCPGLVMPSFVFTKAELILNGILPIDQMRDHVPPINLVASLIPRHVFENMYGIMLPVPVEGEYSTYHPTTEELLNAYAYNRGFMTANGQPDNSRAARLILKDYVNGKLLYCHAPPNIEHREYQTWPQRQKIRSCSVTPRATRAIKVIFQPNHNTSGDIDKVFFQTTPQNIHFKGIDGKPAGLSTSISSPLDNSTEQKPWKQHNKHKNKLKKEKLRRLYAHLDQH